MQAKTQINSSVNKDKSRHTQSMNHYQEILLRTSNIHHQTATVTSSQRIKTKKRKK
jgi:hypothetical protein